MYEGVADYFTLTKERSSLMDIEGTAKEIIQVEATITFNGKATTTVFSVLDINKVILHILQVQKEHGIQIHGSRYEGLTHYFQCGILGVTLPLISVV